MKDSLLTRIVISFLGLLLLVCPVAVQAVEVDLSPQLKGIDEKVETRNQMTQKQINDLFGEDPYLGQTSYLQSPDGFSYREKSE